MKIDRRTLLIGSGATLAATSVALPALASAGESPWYIQSEDEYVIYATAAEHFSQIKIWPRAYPDQWLGASWSNLGAQDLKTVYNIDAFPAFQQLLIKLYRQMQSYQHGAMYGRGWSMAIPEKEIGKTYRALKLFEFAPFMLGYETSRDWPLAKPVHVTSVEDALGFPIRSTMLTPSGDKRMVRVIIHPKNMHGYAPQGPYRLEDA